MKISKELLIEASQESIYQFLNDLRNHEQLLPLDLISKWESSAEECSFTLKSLIQVYLTISYREPNVLLRATPSRETPVPVSLEWKIDQISESQSLVVYTIDAEINMMMQMIAKPILNQLISNELEQLKLVLQK